MKNVRWPEAIHQCEAAGKGFVIATIINTQGSTPRDGGSKMVIDADETYDTIGGGQLEFLVVQQARELLLQNASCQVLKPFPLAAEARQCCGGNVTVMLECFAASEWQIALFGGGHVCRALVTILAGLPCQVRVVDNRPELMNETLPANCRYQFQQDPAEAVTGLPDNAWAVIFTHDHALDYRLCETLLHDGRFCYLGLIGSQTKANRFRKRLEGAGFSNAQLNQMHSPIGLPEVKGKYPMEVAVSIAAQLQSVFYGSKPAKESRSTSWRQVKQILNNSQRENEKPL